MSHCDDMTSVRLSLPHDRAAAAPSTAPLVHPPLQEVTHREHRASCRPGRDRPHRLLRRRVPGQQDDRRGTPPAGRPGRPGIIRILDLVFVTRELDGSVKAINIADFDGDGTLDLAVFEGASSGLLGEDDIDDATSVIEPGSSAGILVYENVWAAPFAAALRRGGAQLVASGRIPVQAILASLDAAEAAEAAEAADASA